jgi:hypothetical protein
MTTMPKDPLAGVQFKKLLPIIIIGVFVVAAVICLFVFFT